MHRMLAIFTIFAILSGTSQAAATKWPPLKQYANPDVTFQVKSSDRMTSSRKATDKHETGVTSDFHAEDLIPDICKGCSS